MDKTSLCCNESFMRSVYARTIDKQSGAVIAKALNPTYGKPGSPVIDSTITNVWSKFGGKRGFLDEMELRGGKRKPLAEPHSQKSEPKSLLTENEQLRLAHFCMRRYSIETSLEKIGRPEITAKSVISFISKRHGSCANFYKEIGPKVHEQRRRGLLK